MKTKYLVIGNGRLSQHLQHYFSLLDLPFQVWTRHSPENVDSLITNADRICLAVSDKALSPFVAQHPLLTTKTTIHFSGSQNIPGIFSAHPLMTFGPHLYTREIYLAIPFITVRGEPQLRDLFPEFTNPTAQIAAEKKSLYHAYCVMTGNFTTLLWQYISADFAKDLGVDKKLLEPYLQQITANLLKNGAHALTGPIARRDTGTITRNLDALADTPYQNLYYAFLNLVHVKGTETRGSPHEHLRF